MATVFDPVEIVSALPPTLTPEPAVLATPLATPAGGGNYQSQNGDTLESLALRFRTSVEVIQEILHRELPMIQLVRQERFVAAKTYLVDFVPTVWGLYQPERIAIRP